MAHTSKAQSTKARRTTATAKTPEFPLLGDRMKELRKAAKLTQHAIGAQGFVSAPGWIKLENGQRSPSETLLKKFVALLVTEGVIRTSHSAALLDELETLKYVHHHTDYLRRVTRAYYKTLTPVAIQAAPEH